VPVPFGLEQLDPISERIGDVRSSVPGKRLVLDHVAAGRTAALEQRLQVVDQQRRMRLSGGSEIVLDAEVHVGLSCGEPNPSPPRQILRLRLLGHPQDVPVERARLVFLPARHGELHVMEGADHKAIYLSSNTTEMANCTS
jgi:hypothetical protein